MGVVIAFFILVALFSLPQPVQTQAQTGGAKWLLLTLLVGIGLGIIIWKIQGKI